MKKWIIVTVIIVGVAGICGFLYKNHKPQNSHVSNEVLPITATMIASGGNIYVRVAHTDITRELGLSYFKTLPADQGMLFLFDQSGRYPFWMKGMNFPLDIIWLKKVSDNTFRVVYVAENVDPDTYPRSFDPGVDADAVLEINHFRAKFSQIFVGGPDLIVRNYVATKKPVLR